MNFIHPARQFYCWAEKEDPHDPLDVYLYGMTVLSTLHLLDGPYPEADAYQEIKETHIIPGGETANSAIVLAKYGLKTKIDGPFLGTKTKEVS